MALLLISEMTTKSKNTQENEILENMATPSIVKNMTNMSIIVVYTLYHLIYNNDREHADVVHVRCELQQSPRYSGGDCC